MSILAPARAGVRAAALLLLLTGCMGSFSRTTPPDYFQIEYAFQPSFCAEQYPGAVRVWFLSASAPHDREQMVVVTPSREVRISSNHQWISPAGNMLADKLMRDLSMARLFEDAVPVGSPIFAPFEMSGHVRQFALEDGSASYAVLDLEITLWQEKPVRAILFKKNFHYRSAPLTRKDPAVFAEEMSRLVSQLSLDLRNELCTIRQDSSHRVGGL